MPGPPTSHTLVTSLTSTMREMQDHRSQRHVVSSSVRCVGLLVMEVRSGGIDVPMVSMINEYLTRREFIGADWFGSFVGAI
mgnify:CR=1 FL=1